MSVAEAIKRKLEAALEPAALEITDESHLHAGHAGARAGGESHFRVRIVAAAFAGQSRIARQRAVYEILAPELANQIHALSLVTETPAEAGIVEGGAGKTAPDTHSTTSKSKGSVA